MPRIRVFNFLIIVIIILAYAWPTSIQFPLDGFPVNRRGEFTLLLLSVLFLFRQYLYKIYFFKSDGSQNLSNFFKVKRILKVGIGCVASCLLIIKLLTPPSAGIELKIKNPQVEEGFRYTSERFINKVEYGGLMTPWRMGFLNSGQYSTLNCQPNDALCMARRNWKQTLSVPFEATFRVPRSWLKDSSQLNIEFLGSIEVLSENKVLGASYFSAPRYQHVSIPLPQSSAPVEVRYRNFECKSGDFSQCLNENTKPLSFSEGILRIETPPPFHLAIAKWMALSMILILCCLFLGLIGCELAESAFPIRQLFAVRPPKEWVALACVCTSVLVIYFLMIFEKSLLKTHWTFLWVQLIGLLLCIYLTLFKQLTFSSVGRGVSQQAFSRISIDLLFTLPGLLYLYFVVKKLPGHDGFYLLNDGDDWLTYTAVAYNFIESPGWFSNAHFVFTKPLYIYFRAFLYFLLGEGTTYIEIFLRYSLALLPLLLLPAISDLLARVQKAKWLIGMPIMAFSFFWCLKNFASYVLIFWVSMGEIPAWLFGLLACISLIYAALKILDDEDYTFPILAATFFSFLTCVSRLQSIAVLILPWVAVASISKREKKWVLMAGLYCGFITLALILGHAAPTLLNESKGLVAYLGWTTQMKSSDPILTVLQLFWERVTFAPQVTVLLLFLPVISGVSLYFNKRTGGSTPVLFWLTFALSLALHAVIRDAAYPPRHYVFLSQVVAYLTILFTLVLLRDVRSSSSSPVRRTPP